MKTDLTPQPPSGPPAWEGRGNSLSASLRTAFPSIAVSVGLCVAFVTLAVAVRAGMTDAFDVRLLRWTQGYLLPRLSWLWQAVSWPGYAPQLIGVAAFLAALAWRYAGRRGLLLTLIALLSWPLGSVVKQLVVRLRPTSQAAQVVGQAATSASFPSGHVVTYTAICGIVALLVLGARAEDGWRRWRDTGLAALLLALVVLIGPARVALGQHWPTDTLGGYLLGGALLTFLARWST